jgi:hypothetical protein
MALRHGMVKATVVLGYTVLAAMLYNMYLSLLAATVAMLLVRVALNALMIAGNYRGGNIVYKS